MNDALLLPCVDFSLCAPLSPSSPPVGKLLPRHSPWMMCQGVSFLLHFVVGACDTSEHADAERVNPQQH